MSSSSRQQMSLFHIIYYIFVNKRLETFDVNIQLIYFERQRRKMSTQKNLCNSHSPHKKVCKFLFDCFWYQNDSREVREFSDSLRAFRKLSREWKSEKSGKFVRLPHFSVLNEMRIEKSPNFCFLKFVDMWWLHSYINKLRNRMTSKPLIIIKLILWWKR